MDAVKATRSGSAKARVSSIGPSGEAGAEVPPLELEKFLPYRLAVLSAEVSRGLSQIYARQFQLSVPEWRIIANLGRFGPLNAGDLAERSSLDKPKVTRALQKLEARGLVQRAVEVRDRRQVRLSLTRRGRTTLAEIAKLALAWERQLAASLSPEDTAALDRIIAALVNQARVSGVTR